MADDSTTANETFQIELDFRDKTWKKGFAASLGLLCCSLPFLVAGIALKEPVAIVVGGIGTAMFGFFVYAHLNPSGYNCMELVKDDMSYKELKAAIAAERFEEPLRIEQRYEKPIHLLLSENWVLVGDADDPLPIPKSKVEQVSLLFRNVSLHCNGKHYNAGSIIDEDYPKAKEVLVRHFPTKVPINPFTGQPAWTAASDDELEADWSESMDGDIRVYDFGMVEKKAVSARWGENFRLQCDTVEQIPYAEKCLAFLDAMPTDMERRLKKYLYRYYEDTASWVDDEEIASLGPITEETAMDHIRIRSVIVSDSCRQDRIEFHSEGTCGWEPEHGLEVTISDGKILYVGPYEDYDPNAERLAYALEHYGFYDPDADPIMNYADKE